MYIEVLDYDSLWPEAFQSEARLIHSCLPQIELELYHVGSTSVPGLSAKPIIDILMIVPDFLILDEEPPLADLGYEAKGEFGIFGRRYFRKDKGFKRTHQIHAYKPRHPEIESHLVFRDYLRAFPQVSKEYGDIKIQAALECRQEIQLYMDIKAPFIQKTLLAAKLWKEKQ